MILCIDVGNTGLSCAVFAVQKTSKVLLERFSLATERQKTEYQYFIDFSALFAHFKINSEGIKKVIIASVVPELERVLELCFRRLFKISAVTFLQPRDVKLKVNLKNPAEVGVDRVVNVFSAFKTYEGAGDVIVIDLGTALTFDIGINGGEYEGGLIYAGLNLSLEALRSGTSKLPKITLKKPESIVGKSTAEAINAGIFYGYSAMINGVIAQIKAHYGKNFRVVLTGGLSSHLAPYFNFEFEENEMLTLFGIAYFA